MTTSDEQLQLLISEEWQFRLSEDPFLATMVGDDRYNDQVPGVSTADEARRVDKASEFLVRLESIARANLSSGSQLNLDMFVRELRERVASYRFGEYLMPLAKLSGPHSLLPDLVLVTPFRTETDFSAYVQRLRGLGDYLAGLIDRMRTGMRVGVVQARSALAGVEESFHGLIVSDPVSSIFYAPFLQFPASVPLVSRHGLENACQDAIRDVVVPGFQRMLAFIETEYLPAARIIDGISALPDGGEYYSFLVKKFTTLDVSPRQVHEIGLGEVDRIQAEMRSVIDAAGFVGSFHEFIDFLRTDPRFYVTRPLDLLKEVALIMKRMEGELPRLFMNLPRTPFGMRETPAHIAPRSTTAYYFPATGDGTTAGYYYINTYDLPSRPLYEYEALSFHEAVPGHHLQLALQQEMSGVPDFRRYSQIDAFIEGWALYAERLGMEVGFYQDPYSNFGRLIFEMWRAARLVVDTGIHSMGWSRQQAIDYMIEYTALTRLNVENEVDRYIAWPGQALAYKMGEIKIRELRQIAEQQLGIQFDIRKFHQVLLEDGAVPLSILESKIRRWLGQQ